MYFKVTTKVLVFITNILTGTEPWQDALQSHHMSYFLAPYLVFWLEDSVYLFLAFVQDDIILVQMSQKMKGTPPVVFILY